MENEKYAQTMWASDHDEHQVEKDDEHQVEEDEHQVNEDEAEWVQVAVVLVFLGYKQGKRFLHTTFNAPQSFGIILTL